MEVDEYCIAVDLVVSLIESLDLVVDQVHLDVLGVHSSVVALLSGVEKAWHQVGVDASYVAMGRLGNVMDQLASSEVVIPIAVVDTFAEEVSEQEKRQVEIVDRTFEPELALELVLEHSPELERQLAVEPS